jgi:beta-galactosidase
VAWYRKNFTLPAAAASRRVFVEFDGVMANSDVFLNGTPLGHRPYGYSGLRYELTGSLKFGPGQANVLAVRADTSQQPASRWFAGAGIYRHVRLVTTDAVHLEPGSTFITTSKVSGTGATVHVRTTVVNQSGTPRTVAAEATFYEDDFDPFAPHRPVAFPAQTIAPGQSANFEQDFVFGDNFLWSLSSPRLWAAVVAVREGGTELDDEGVTFGIRTVQFDAATGFVLNGQPLKLNGVCLHADGGAFGAAVPLAVWEQRLATLRSIGVNAIRTAHNPPAPEFLDLCDRMGFAVMLETFDTWRAMKPNQRGGYQNYFAAWWEADTRDAVLAARHHPCVVLYSIGNEIRDNLNAATGRNDLVAQRDLIHRLDPTRPVTLRADTSPASPTCSMSSASTTVPPSSRPSPPPAGPRWTPRRRTPSTAPRPSSTTRASRACFCGRGLTTSASRLAGPPSGRTSGCSTARARSSRAAGSARAGGRPRRW